MAQFKSLFGVPQLRGTEKLYRTLIRVENTVDATTGEFLDEAADWLVNDIRSSWSSSSPSPVGAAPAVVTGNLDSSVIVDEQGRSDGGRFASKSGQKVKIVRVDTSKGDDPQGRGNYAQALEDPHYIYNRPFMRPAIKRLESEFVRMAKRKIHP